MCIPPGLHKHPLAAPCARCPSSSGVSQLLCFLRLGLFFPSCVGDKKDASPTTPQLRYYKITQQSPVVAGNDKYKCHQCITDCCASPFLKKHPALSLTLDTTDALWLSTPPLILLELLWQTVQPIIDFIPAHRGLSKVWILIQSAAMCSLQKLLHHGIACSECNSGNEAVGFRANLDELCLCVSRFI